MVRLHILVNKQCMLRVLLTHYLMTVFMAYLRAAKGIYMVPLVVLSIALMQGSTVL